jgi:transcription elongation factor GreB
VSRGHISWVSPLARALLKARADDSILLRLPQGVEEILVLAVRYQDISINRI